MGTGSVVQSSAVGLAERVGVRAVLHQHALVGRYDEQHLAAHRAQAAAIPLDPDDDTADIDLVVDDVAEECRVHDGAFECVVAGAGLGREDEGFGADGDGHRRGRIARRRHRRQPVLADHDHRPVAVAADHGRRHPVHQPHEVGDEQVCRSLIDVARRADLLDGPAVEDRDAVGERHGLGLVVGDIDEGDAGAPLQGLQFGAHALAQLGIEVGERLVEEQDRRLDHQRTGKRDTLLLPAAELRRVAVLEALQADRRQNLVDARLLSRAVECGVAETEGDVLQHRHVRPYGVVLKDHAHAPPLRRHAARRRGQHLAADRDRAGVGREETGEEAERRRLATAGGAEKRDELLLLDGDIDAAQRPEGAEVLGQSFDLDVCHACL